MNGECHALGQILFRLYTCTLCMGRAIDSSFIISCKNVAMHRNLPNYDKIHFNVLTPLTCECPKQSQNFH